MKFCRVTKYPPIQGGVSSGAYWLTKNLGEAGHANLIITNANECEEWFHEDFTEEDLKKLEPKNTKLFNITIDKKSLAPVPSFKPYTILLSSMMFDVLERESVDLIESHYLVPYGVSAILYKKLSETKIPVILKPSGSDTQNLLFKPSYRSCLLKTIREFNYIFVNTNKQKLFISENFDVPEEKIFVVGIPIDTKSFNPNIAPIDVRTFDERINPEKPILTFFGKITKTKGVLEFINAAKKLEIDYQILFVGDGPFKNDLKIAVNQLGISDKVFYARPQPPWRVPEIINASSIIVVPQYRFPIKVHFSTVLKEAMACEKPVLASNEISGVEHWIENGKTGFIIDPGNINAFSERIEYLIKNPEKAREIGKNARKKILQNDDMKKYVDLYIEVCKTILEGENNFGFCDI